MTYEEFIDFVKSKCMYETIYEDSEGRLILVIDLLSAYGMVNKAKRQWVGLTDEERNECTQSPFTADQHRAIEAKLKEKNHV
jgi:hypothetical protein